MFVVLSYFVANTNTPILDMMSYSWGILSGSFLAGNEGKINENDAIRILESKSREMAGNTLPAHGLYLYNIKY